MGKKNEQVVMSWDFAFPLVTNRFFVYDCVKALLWTGAIMILILAVTFALAGSLDGFSGLFPVLGLVLAGFFVMFMLISLVFFGNRFPTRFTLTDRAVYWEGRSRAAKKANVLAIVLGVLARRPAVAGAGLLAASSNAGSLPWKSVRRVKEYPTACVITIMNSWRVVIRLYCSAENYAPVVENVRRLAPAAAINDRA
ncbi:MAG: hypothetical protein MUF02_07255 [Acidobacteria bacterium]|jgi:hypothetical protein|nr:hypothetical protein [Acidobacteriota bacterium]